MMRYLSLALTLLTLASCNRNNQNEMTRFHEDGRAKPSLTIASMIDTTSFDASWSLSEEITTGIRDRLTGTGQIFVHNSHESSLTQNPFGNDLTWMKQEFPNEEFVAFLKLVQHEFTPVQTAETSLQEASNNLNMAVTLRVVDLRSATPKIVLQETIRDTYFVPKTLIPNDYAVDTWGTDNFRKSPMGIAHSLLIQEISSRINDYIHLAKSR